jgi:hypothetical protein
VKLIDTGYSYVEGVNNDYVEVNNAALLMGSVPNVFDSLFDLSVLYAIFQKLIPFDPKNVNRMLKANGFSIKDDPQNRHRDIDFFIGRELNMKWTSLVRSYLYILHDSIYFNGLNIIEMTLDDFIESAEIKLTDALIENKLITTSQVREYKDLDDDIEGTFAQSINEIADQYKNTTLQAFTASLRQDFAAVMKYNKLENIERRPYKTNNIFDAMIESMN